MRGIQLRVTKSAVYLWQVWWLGSNRRARLLSLAMIFGLLAGADRLFVRFVSSLRTPVRTPYSDEAR